MEDSDTSVQVGPPPKCRCADRKSEGSHCGCIVKPRLGHFKYVDKGRTICNVRGPPCTCRCNICAKSDNDNNNDNDNDTGRPTVGHAPHMGPTALITQTEKEDPRKASLDMQYLAAFPPARRRRRSCSHAGPPKTSSGSTLKTPKVAHANFAV